MGDINALDVLVTLMFIFAVASQRRSKTRLMDAENLMEFISEIEKILVKMGLPKKIWVGMRFAVGPAAVVNNSYTGVPMSTSAEIVRKSAGWTLIDVRRERVWQDIKMLNAEDENIKRQIFGYLKYAITTPRFWNR